MGESVHTSIGLYAYPRRDWCEHLREGLFTYTRKGVPLPRKSCATELVVEFVPRRCRAQGVRRHQTSDHCWNLPSRDISSSVYPLHKIVARVV